LFGCGGSDNAKEESISKMEKLAGAVYEYYDIEKKWPESFDVPEFQEDVGGSDEFKKLMDNPLTGDNPGYQYVKPPDGTPKNSDVIIIYQLRDGQRDLTVDAFALDGTVRQPE
jgi:hypothetical protein